MIWFRRDRNGESEFMRPTIINPITLHSLPCCPNELVLIIWIILIVRLNFIKIVTLEIFSLSLKINDWDDFIGQNLIHERHLSGDNYPHMCITYILYI